MLIDNDNEIILFAYKLLINWLIYLLCILYIALLLYVAIVASEYIAVYLKFFIKN